MDPITIATERVVLDDFVDQAGDLLCVEAASTDPAITSITTVPAAYSTDEGRAFIARQIGRRDEGIGWSLAIREAATRRAVGQIGLWTPELHKGRAEIGYWVSPSKRGHGFATAALDALSGWAFDHLDLARLSLSIEPGNAASIATARSAGFEREGLLRAWQVVDRQPRDMVSFVRVPTAPTTATERVRRFRVDDRTQVIELWRDAELVRPKNDPDRDIDLKLAVADRGFFVAVDDTGRVVGSVMAGYDGHRGWINYLAVSSQARGRGIGGELMDAATAHLRSLGCPKINLQVRDGNTAAMGFYESLGYTPDNVTSLGLRLGAPGETPLSESLRQVRDEERY